MSDVAAPNFNRFLRALHRRMHVVRALERVGLAVLISCAVALPLVLLLAWRGAPALPTSLICLALGALAGAVWAGKDPPTLLAAAMEADQQLNLADLLGSALLATDGEADGWRQSLLAVADERCRNLKNADVFLARVSPRTWSLIGLATLVVLTLSVWVGRPTPILAADSRTGLASSALPGDDDRPLLAPVDLGQHPSAAPREGEDPAANPPATADAHSPQNSGESAADRSEHDRQQRAANAGQGGQLARSSAPIEFTKHDASAAVGNAAANSTGQVAGGNGRAVEESGRTGAADGIVAMNGARANVSAPWQSVDWPRDVADAMAEMRRGDAPATYHDLLRDYFQRQ
jgi:hypothetical protein